jgi:hypothetical protein
MVLWHLRRRGMVSWRYRATSAMHARLVLYPRFVRSATLSKHDVR